MKKILILHPDMHILAALRDLLTIILQELTLWPVGIHTAVTQTDAIKIIETEFINLLILHHDPIRMNSLDLLRTLQGGDVKMIIILMTSTSSEIRIDDSNLPFKIHAILERPISRNQMKDMLSMLLCRDKEKISQ
jgi:DNA-binding NtrC family response regulator